MRNKIIIFSIGLAVIILLFWLVVFRPSDGSTSDQELTNILTDLSEQPAVSDTIAEPEIVLPEPRPVKVELRSLSNSDIELGKIQNMVRAFVEIWGSVSNQDDLSTLRGLDDQMTPKVRSFRDLYVDDIKATYPYAQGYFGVTTQVVSVSFEDETTLASHLTAQVGTRRTESVGDRVREYNQDVDIELIKISGDWLVDGVFWNEP